MIASAKRIGLIARVSLIGAVRRKAPRILFLLAAAVALGARYLRDLDFGGQGLKFISDLGLGAISLFGSLFALVAASGLVLGELEARTAPVILAKPIGRPEYILGKLAAALVLVAAYCAGTTALLIAVLFERSLELPGAGLGLTGAISGVGISAIVEAGFLICLKLAVLAAATVLMASFSRSAPMAILLGAGILAIGQFQFLLQFPTAGNRAGFGALASACIRLLPDFRAFDVGGLAIETGGPGASLMLRVSLYALLHIAAAATLAVLCFRHREI